MSEEKKSPENEENPLDLSGLNFGPAWARSESESKTVKKYKDRGDCGASGRPGGGKRRDGGGHGDRRGGGGGRNAGRDQGRRGDGRDGGRQRPRREEIPAPEGVQGSVMPVEESLDKLGKEIKTSGRAYSVFDLAKFLLQARDRYQVTFQREKGKLSRCVKDNSLWLNKEEAKRHLWRAEWRTDFYEEIQHETEAPKGNFQAVAKCGISGEYLGPPNYHDYQANVAKMHRERFSHMSLEAYKSKVRMEHGEEAVQAWLDSMKTVTRWRARDGDEIAKMQAEASAQKEAGKDEKTGEKKPEVAEVAESEEKSAEAQKATDEKLTGETAEKTVAAPEKTVSEEAAEKPAAPKNDSELAETPEEKEGPENTEEVENPAVDTETSADSGEVAAQSLLDEKEVATHFADTHFAKVFIETERAWVAGDIKGNLLSPGLLTLLKNTVAEEKRYPGKLTPVLCRQLSGRHVAVYKWRKKLKAGPSRPHAVPEDIKLSERPQRILDWLGEHGGKKLFVLWEAVFPEKADEKTKREWFHDLHWVLNQGYAVFLSDTSLHLAKKPGGAEKAAGKEKREKKASTEKSEKPERQKSEVGKENPEATESSEEKPAQAESSSKTEDAKDEEK